MQSLDTSDVIWIIAGWKVQQNRFPKRSVHQKIIIIIFVVVVIIVVVVIMGKLFTFQKVVVQIFSRLALRRR